MRPREKIAQEFKAAGGKMGYCGREVNPMQFCPNSRRRSRCALVLAGCAVLLLLLPADGAGQQPPQSAAQALPPPANFQNPIPAAQLAFLSAYAGQPVKVLLKDKRYRSLLKRVTPRTTYHYGRDMTLAYAVDMVMDGSKAPVEIRDSRYALIAGANGPYLRGRGFMWFDLQAGTALGVFYFQPTNGEPTPTLTVFSRQLTDMDLSIGQLPLAFDEDLGQWALLDRTPAITPRYFIPENGKKYVLLHDEDYCAHAPGQAVPPANICEQLMDQAADADVNAAYFMHETHNAANATAWMLGPDQTAWLSFRMATCGVTLACRIRVTRERTRVLLARR